MPQFSPGESKVAIATFPVSPAGLICTAELWLGSNSIKATTSGEVPFVATGVDQSITLPVTMPSIEGTYPVYLHVFSNGLLIVAYQGEDVVIGIAPPVELVVPGWIVDDKDSMQVWWPLKEPILWSNIFREEYIKISRGLYDTGVGSGLLCDGYWSGIAPYTLEYKCIGQTETIWVTEGLRYRIITIVDFLPQYGQWQYEVEEHWLGVDSPEGREYWKTQIPTGVPVSFAFYQSKVEEDALRELESAGAADVTNIFWIYWSVNWPLCFRAIIYDLDGFFNILRKYQWLHMAGKIVE